MAELGFQSTPEVMTPEQLLAQCTALVGGLIVYRAYQTNDRNKSWKRYAGLLQSKDGVFTVLRSSEYNYLPLCEPVQGEPQVISIPAVDWTYTRIVRSSVFLTEYARYLEAGQNQLQTAHATLLRRVADLEARQPQGTQGIQGPTQGGQGYGSSYLVWYDPTTWAAHEPRSILLELRAQLGVSEASTQSRRQAFAQLENIIWGAMSLPGWEQTRAVDAIAQQIRYIRDSIARDAGIDMVRLARELAVEEEDPYRAALIKAGSQARRARGRGSSWSGGRGTRRVGVCWTCGEAGHMSPECPTGTKQSEAAPTPKNRGRGAQH